MRFALAVLLTATACGSKSNFPAVPVTERVVVISVDGMMPATYLDPDAHGLKIPTLRKLVAAGAAGSVRSVMPTVTYPSHTTMVTGVPPKVHGIVTNKPQDPLGKNFDGWRWYAEDIAVPTIYQAAEAQHRHAALIVWPVTVGAKASFVVPEYWRAGNPDDQKLLRALVSPPGALDDIATADPELWKSLVPPDIKDKAQISIARHVIAHQAPALTMLHIFELDDAQHDHGPWSDEAKKTIEGVDEQLGLLIGDLEKSPEWAHTTVIIVSDHGFAPVEHEIRLGALFAKHGLTKTNEDGDLVESPGLTAIAQGGTAMFYVDEAHKAAVDVALAELGDHVARRLDHDQIVALGGDPKASFALVAAPKHGFSDKRMPDKKTGAAVVDVSPRGTHGWPPDDPAMLASVILYGPHVRHGSLGTVDMTQIAPTIAKYLGIEFPGTPIKL